MTNPIAIATQGKGLGNFVRRVRTISAHYGPTPAQMTSCLDEFADVLAEFGCGATFPITAVALGRNPRTQRYEGRGVEFAIHGLRHIDHSQLELDETVTHLDQARQIFKRAGMTPKGFRCPYLRWNPGTLEALRRQGFEYDSSQAIAWSVVEGCDTPAYRRAQDFYGAISADEYPSLPRLEGGLVCIPYSLPDDEALVDRLAVSGEEQMSRLWLEVLRCSHERGELFTIGLHPERIGPCKAALRATLAAARALGPQVWIARLDEIAAWWRARAEARIETRDAGEGRLEICANGPEGVTLLARGVEVEAATTRGAQGYERISGALCVVRAPVRPLIGLAPDASPALGDFLRQQGYGVEVSPSRDGYGLYYDRPEFRHEDERALLQEIEGGNRPLVRLGRWPGGAQSALCVSGDVDAITIWDYALRFLGH